MLLLIILWFAIVVLAIFALVFFFKRLWHGIYLIERKPDETHWLKTLDGWRIALHRFVPKRRLKNIPVLLCHGMAGNALSWDFSETHSLARYLNQKGFEVWAIDLRGAGMSMRPVLFGNFRFNYDFYDYLESDLYRAVDHIKQFSKVKNIYFVGHSMGGMLAYAYLSGDRKKDIARAVVMGSPGDLDWLKKFLRFRFILKVLPYVPLGSITQAVAPVFEWIPSISRLIGTKLENRPLGHISYQAANLTENIPTRLIKQFLMWCCLDSKEQSPPFNVNMSSIETPILVIAGGDDKTVPPDIVKAGFEKIGSKDKHFVIMSRKLVFEHDYDHNDLLLAKAAPKEVYSLVSSWLSEEEAKRFRE